MASLSYATPGTGPSAGGIGWVNFGTFSLAPGVTVNNITATLRDGSTLSFSINQTTVSGGATTIVASPAPTYGGAPFGNSGYTGISGNVSLWANAFLGSARLTFSNITVTDPFGVPVPNYYLYLVDAEATATGETLVFTTNGDNWNQFTIVGSGTSPTISGVGTQTVTLSGSGTTTYRAYMVNSLNPTQLTASFTEAAGAGRSAVALGISINRIQLAKIINSRYDASDQFNLNILGAPSATTTTFGSTYGTQSVFTYIYASIPGTFTLNETMTAGSASPLSSYNPRIAYTNATPGGTTVPSSTALPGTLSLNTGDVVYATITNAILPTTVTSSKAAISFTDINSVVTYTLTLNNQGPVTVNNVIFKDTIPSGTTFQTDSVQLNGSPIAGNPSPPTGINLGSLPVGISTITFNVLVTTIPTPNPFLNSASFTYSYNALPTNGSGSTNTNTVSTKVNSAYLTNSKQVSKTYANVGDVLTYTIPITNTGNITTSSITFIDTIPNGTSLVSGSLKQDGIALSGSPNPPGITINNIGPGKTSTIVFKVTILTIPTPNPIPNNATTAAQYVIDPTTPRSTRQINGTNTVNTQVNNANLGNIVKQVDKNYATCGESINYTIVIPNSGNVTAQNVILKDTIPNGTSLITTSIFVNGVQQLGANPTTGITIPNIAPGASATVTFSVQVNC